MKYLFTVIENVGQFSRSIENPMFNLFFKIFFQWQFSRIQDGQ